jgi:arylmalonate decarboxylase
MRIGAVVPTAGDELPSEGAEFYPQLSFIARGVGVKALTPEGLELARSKIVPAALALADQGVEAIMIFGTSLTFFRGRTDHDAMVAELRMRTGIPVSSAIIGSLGSFGARRPAVATAYSDAVNDSLRMFLDAHKIGIARLEAFGITEFAGARRKTAEEIVALVDKSVSLAERPDAILISCGGLRTSGIVESLEHRHGLPVVSSTLASFWMAARLVGITESGMGPGRLFNAQPTEFISEVG